MTSDACRLEHYGAIESKVQPKQVLWQRSGTAQALVFASRKPVRASDQEQSEWKRRTPVSCRANYLAKFFNRMPIDYRQQIKAIQEPQSLFHVDARATRNFAQLHSDLYTVD